MMKFIPQLPDYSKYDDPRKRPNPKPQCDGCEKYFDSWEDLTEVNTVTGMRNYCEECLEIYKE